MSSPPTPQSPRRLQLCSRENASRIAGRLFDHNHRSVSVVKTGEPMQPLRVMPSTDVTDPSSEIVVVTA